MLELEAILGHPVKPSPAGPETRVNKYSPDEIEAFIWAMPECEVEPDDPAWHERVAASLDRRVS